MKRLALFLSLLTVPCHAGTCRVVWNLGSQGHGHGDALPCEIAHSWERDAWSMPPGELRYVEKRVLFVFWVKDDEPGREERFWNKDAKREQLWYEKQEKYLREAANEHPGRSEKSVQSK